MADGFPVTPGTGRTVATDEIGGVDYQIIKVVFGPLDTATLVTALVGFPVSIVNASVAVTGTFWQATQPVSAASLPLPSGAATEATLGNVLTTADFDAKVGSLTETAPATDTASSGLNGRLQRIAQRLTSLIALLPAALTGAGNLKVSLQESAASQAVTNAGTFATQAAQSGTWTVQPGNTANTTAWKVDASGTTVPVTGTFWQATQPVNGTVAATQSGTWNVATLTGITNVVHVDDNSGSLTVDGTVSVSGTVTVDSELTTADLDTGAGTDTRAVVGLVLAASGGGLLVGSANPMPVSGTFWQATQPVSGTVAATQSGTWNVATVTTVTTVAAVTAITNALPAGTNLLGKVADGLATDVIYNGTTALTPKFAAISTAVSGNTTVVAGVGGKKIRVLQYRFQAGGDVDVKFRDNTAAVDLTGAMATGAKGGGGGAAFCPVGLFETAASNALSINLSGAVQVSGSLVYVEV